jgi:hypothetical protein
MLNVPAKYHEPALQVVSANDQNHRQSSRLPRTEESLSKACELSRQGVAQVRQSA